MQFEKNWLLKQARRSALNASVLGVVIRGQFHIFINERLKKMNKSLLTVFVLATQFLAGCASITGNTNQNVSVQTKEPTGAEVVGANCELSNSKGKWFVVTPGTVGIHRSNDDIQILCRKDGYEPGKNGIVSETKGMMFGNIIFGGGIGAIVDHSSGAAYEYPSLFQILMSKLQNSERIISAQEKLINQNSSLGNSSGNEILEKKLKELKYLFDEKLITQEAYIEQQKILLQK
jgi:hypothetical protein